MAFAKRSIEGYAEGLVRLSKKLKRVFEKAESADKEVVLVVPSRGAYIPTMGALYALGVIDKEKLKQPHRFTRESFSPIRVGSVSTRVLLIPLTADTGKQSIISRHLEDHHIRAYEDTERLLSHIRRGGMHILKTLLSYPPEEREKDTAFRVFTRLLELEGRYGVADAYRRFYTEDPIVVLIDTAISGSAVSHILSGAKKEQLRLLPLIIADENGTKLGSREKRVIQDYLDWGSGNRIRLENVLIPIPDLITENRGAALQGLWAAIYPQVVGELVSRGIYGLGGTWHPVPQKKKEYVEVYSSFAQMLAEAVNKVRGVENRFDEAYNKFSKIYKENKKKVTRHRVMTGKELVKEVGLPAITYKSTAISENNNRVIHIHFPKTTWKRKIKQRLFE